jgi:nucleoid-associated protein YgaU
MFDATSRYANIPQVITQIRNTDGTSRTVAYVQRRIIPPADDSLVVVEHAVTQGDRLDNITARYLGNPLLFWKVCDANNVGSPEDLEVVGRVVKISLSNL